MEKRTITLFISANDVRVHKHALGLHVFSISRDLSQVLSSLNSETSRNIENSRSV